MLATTSFSNFPKRFGGLVGAVMASGLGMSPAWAAPASADVQSGLAFLGAALGGAVLTIAIVWAIARRARAHPSSPAPQGHSPLTLMDSLARVQGRYIQRQEEVIGFEALLQDVLTLTQSAYGVLQHCTDQNGSRALKRMAVAWHDSLSPDAMVASDLPDLEEPIRTALHSRQPVFAPPADGSGAPTFCAVPLSVGDVLVGALALANRDGGYTEALLAHWSPVMRATAQTLYSLHQRGAHDAAQEAIALAAEQQRLILENTTDGILILDEHLAVSWMNRAIERLFGYTPDTLIGTPGAVLIEVTESTRADGWGKQQFAEQTSRFLGDGAETMAVHSRGRRFPITVAVTPIDGGANTAYVATLHDISRQRRDADALARSEQEIRSILDNMADIFYRTDLAGRLVMISRSVTGLLGYSQKELLGTLIADLYETPESRDEFLTLLETEGGEVTDYRTTLLRKNGERVWVSTNARYWKDNEGNVTGVEGTTRDMTQSVGAEQALIENERQFRAIADYTFEWESWIDPNGRLIWVSPGVERVSGYSPAECLAMADYPTPLVHPDDLRTYEGAMVRPQGDALEIRFIRKDGNEVWGALSWQAIADDAGTDLGIRTSVRDITDAKRVENHLDQHSKLATLGETAAGLVHELSQPLNIIRLAAEGTLLKMESSELDVREQHHQFSLIEGQARRMGEIIDHIRVFSRKDQGQADFFNPLDAIGASLDLLADQLRTDGIVLVRDIPDTPCVVSGRQVQLEQVVLNLLTNARDSIIGRRESTPDSAPNGQITVIAELDSVASTLRITVEDNGAGFPEHEIERIFEPFFTTKDVGLGTGLGLSVSFGIITALGGDIRAKNIDDGAAITLTLPIESDDVLIASPTRPTTADPFASPAEGPWHALVVDDEQDAAFAIATFIEGLGLRVSIGHDGEEAMEIFQADPADIVITDIRMPKMDGHALIKKLRIDAPDLPVVVITGHFDDPRSGTDIRQSNPDTVLRKPVSLEALRAALEELLTTPKPANGPPIAPPSRAR